MTKDRLIWALETVKTRIKEKTPYGSGICREITDLCLEDSSLSNKDMAYLRNFITINIPNETQYEIFYHSSSFRKNKPYWWEPIYEDESTRQIRIDYLQAVIDNIS